MLWNLLITADPQSFGRVDPASMPDQTLLELLVSDIENTTVVRDKEGVFLDILSWDGLTFTAGEVTQVNFAAEITFDDENDTEEGQYILGPKGSIDLRWVPRTVHTFSISDLDLHGTVETSGLAEALWRFNISSNKFTGTFCIASLPQKIEEVGISFNQLRGTLDIAKLPRNLIKFAAERNKFHGSLDCSRLPENMTTLRLSHNDFAGAIDLSALPPTMKFFGVKRTKVEQERLVIRVPAEGVRFFRLNLESFGSVVDTDGNNLEDKFIYNWG